MKAPLIVLCVLAIGAPAVAQSSLFGTEEMPIKPSQLNSFPERYNGQSVIVEGYVNIGPESHMIYESKQLFDEFGREIRSSVIFNSSAYDKFCLTIANPSAVPYAADPKVKFEGRTMTISGKFIDNYLDPKKREIDFGACSSTAIVVEKILN